MPSISVTLWSFDKKKNSTKLPASAGTEFTGEMKQSFTLTGLEIRFNLGSQLVAPTYNYAQIPSLRRYYFITDWYYDRGFWIAVMAVDVLASFKLEIGNSSQYVLRSYSRYTPGIIDTSYPTTGEVTRTSSQIAAGTFWGADVTQDTGLIVMGVIGNSSSSVGAVTYYALTMPAFQCHAVFYILGEYQYYRDLRRASEGAHQSDAVYCELPLVPDSCQCFQSGSSRKCYQSRLVVLYRSGQSPQYRWIRLGFPAE